MSRQSQQPIITVLLLWTSLLSIIQTVFIILFFTSEHRVPPQNNSTAERTVQYPPNITTSVAPPVNLKRQMVTFQASEVNGWTTADADNVVANGGKEIIIKNDGYYFLILQVTLQLKTSRCPCNGTMTSAHPDCTVHLIWNNKDILQGGIHAHTCSTGLLGKVELLPGGSRLQFRLPAPQINETESSTHLDIIYMSKI